MSLYNSIFGFIEALYLKLTGRSGGQTIIGGISTGEDLIIKANSNNDGTIKINPDGGYAVIGGATDEGHKLTIGDGTDTSGIGTSTLYITENGTTYVTIRNSNNNVESLIACSTYVILGSYTNQKLELRANNTPLLTLNTDKTVENVSGVPGLVGYGDTTARDSVTAKNGMIFYNTDTHKFQGRANGTWVDLH